MLLQALYEYGNRKKLTENLPFQMRTVHLLIPLTKEGALRGTGVVGLFTPVIDGKKEKQVLGRAWLLPRFPGENNGGKAYFLAEKCASVLGIDPETGQPLPVEPRSRSEKFPVQAYRHFWQRIDDAHVGTQDDRLLALKKFRQNYLPEKDGFLAPLLPFVEMHLNEKTGKQEWGASTGAGGWVPFAKANTLSFEVDGQFIFLDEPGDAIREYWRATFEREAKEADAGNEESTPGANPTLCLVSGQVGQPLARSHKPKILGVPGLASGGYIVSFAREAPAFSSFGFEMGENAPVSQGAVAGYALALNHLLAGEDTNFRIGEACFCFWANNAPQASHRIGRLMNRPNPKIVREFLVAPFAGLVDRAVAHKDFFHSVMLSGNAGRVVVRSWMREPLDQAIDHFAQWFRDLEIVELTRSNPSDEENAGSPYSLFRLAAATVRDSKELKHKGDLIGQLYRAALEGLPLPLALLKPVLDEFTSTLVKQDPMRPWSNPSRFAFIKMILLRNPRKEFVPMPHLADTSDPAYNLGRLFAVLARLQDAAHEYQLQGAGVIERYYAGASTAPAAVFGILWRLHNHHLRKLEQQGERGSKAASAIRGKIAEIIGKFAAEPGQPPQFPRILMLEQQGRFALGFYQQEAAERQAIGDAKERKAAESKTA